VRFRFFDLLYRSYDTSNPDLSEQPMPSLHSRSPLAWRALGKSHDDATLVFVGLTSNYMSSGCPDLILLRY
jgi:hypothetical protein